VPEWTRNFALHKPVTTSSSTVKGKLSYMNNGFNRARSGNIVRLERGAAFRGFRRPGQTHLPGGRPVQQGESAPLYMVVEAVLRRKRVRGPGPTGRMVPEPADRQALLQATPGGEDRPNPRRSDQGSLSFTHNIVYSSNGKLLGDSWDKQNFYADYNLYWDTSGAEKLEFGDKSFKGWQELANDLHSRVARPHFVNPEKGNFAFTEDSPAYDLGIERIDLDTVGPRSD
jgi:hypothetical protein